MDADVWVEFGEALALGVDFEAVGVTCGKTPGVDILTIVAGFTVISVVVFGSTEGFAVLCISLVWLETTLMVWLVFSVMLILEVSTEWFPLAEPTKIKTSIIKAY